MGNTSYVNGPVIITSKSDDCDMKDVGMNYDNKKLNNIKKTHDKKSSPEDESKELYRRFMNWVYYHEYNTSPVTDKNIDPLKDCFLMYKLVRVKTGSRLSTNVAALLTVGVNPSKTPISHSESYNLIKRPEMKQKYCVSICSVISVQFIGSPEDVKEILEDFAKGRVKLISNVNNGDNDFEYILGNYVEEKMHLSREEAVCKGYMYLLIKSQP